MALLDVDQSVRRRARRRPKALILFSSRNVIGSLMEPRK